MGFAEAVQRIDRSAQKLLGGVPVLYRPKYGTPVTVTGIFDDSFLLAQGSDDQAGTEARVPTVNLVLADLPSDPMTDDPIITIGGIDYRVWERKPADFGSIVLWLRKVV